jgi:two-component system, OmpR family, sensor kinase
VASTPHVREGWPLDWIAHALVSARHLDVFRETRMLSGGQKLSLLDLDQIQVQGDPDRLKQLLLILVDNAIKYTPEAGEIRLTLRLEAGSALVTVSDSGIGIDPEDLPHLFDRFYRADRARARDHGGTGLGLAIAKWIAERHGGQITVESAPGNGTTVSVRLPAVPVTAL